MARKSILERSEKRVKAVKKHLAKRLELKKIIKSVTDFEERMTAQKELGKLPLNSNPVRSKRRCQQCGRSHGIYQKFGLCRICLRQQLMNGNVTGGRKSSW